MPINEETLLLLNSFVASDIRLQSYLVDIRWELLKDSLAQMQFEDALILKMIVINFRLVSDMFDVEQFDEIFDVINEIEVARNQQAIKSTNIKQWANVLSTFLRNLGVGIPNSDSSDRADVRRNFRAIEGLLRKHKKGKFQ